MQMSNEEIVRDYREAKDKKAQVGILADLNLCSREQIVEVLREGGTDATDEETEVCSEEAEAEDDTEVVGDGREGDDDDDGEAVEVPEEAE